MTDTIAGKVINIIDENTFELNPTHYHRNNHDTYSGKKSVKISNIEINENPSISKNRTLQNLKNTIFEKFVVCYIKEIDNKQNLVCNVYLAEKVD